MIELTDAVNHFRQYMTANQLSKILGVTPDQVYKYGTGTTSTCNDSVVDAFYDNLTINGKPVLINYYESEEQYLMLRKAKNVKAE